jgi:predicted pyridoxine 5'-phosphate oxidase superfamily flavin-nucleotide-binding protein
MGKQFTSIDPSHREFIERQRIFFVASATAESRVNISPKDVASLRILDANRVAYLDQTGSGNETAAHLRVDGRVTLMFCALDGAPLILRLYGKGKTLARGSAAYTERLASSFAGIEGPGSRQIIAVDVELVQTSCGYGVPLFDFAEERTTLRRWAEAKGEQGILEYWRAKNTVSIDGLPTGILDFAGGDSEAKEDPAAEPHRLDQQSAPAGEAVK